jgi:Fe-S-cluster containining protein
VKSLSERCAACTGFCCSRHPWDSVQIEKREVKIMRNLGAKVISEGHGRWYMPFDKDRCMFHKDGKCSIYEKRPAACRGWDCADSPNFCTMFARRFPKVYLDVFGDS